MITGSAIAAELKTDTEVVKGKYYNETYTLADETVVLGTDGNHEVIGSGDKNAAITFVELADGQTLKLVGSAEGYNGLIQNTTINNSGKFNGTVELVHDKKYGAITNNDYGNKVNITADKIKISSGFDGMWLNTAYGNKNEVKLFARDINIQAPVFAVYAVTSDVDIKAKESILIKSTNNNSSIVSHMGSMVKVGSYDENKKADITLIGDIYTLYNPSLPSFGAGHVEVSLETAKSSLTGAVGNYEGVYDYEDTRTLTLSNGATWNVTDDSNVTNLKGTDGIVKLGLKKDGTVTTVTVTGTNELTSVTGNGDVADAIAAGTVDVEELATAMSGDDTKITSVSTDEGLVAGAMSATVDAQGNVGPVVQAVNKKAEKVSKAGTNLKAHYRAHMNDMNKRMGELRMANGETGVWTRMVRGESEYQGAKSQYNQYQLGYDEKLSVDKRWTVGAAVTFAEGDGSYGQGSTEDKSTAFAIYGSKLNNDGTFVDLIARYAHLESDLEDGVYGKGDYSTNGMSVSAEFGKRIQQGNGLWIEPQVELTYGTVDSANFAFDRADVHFDSMDSFIARAGFALGKDIKQGNVYARASYLYDFDGETTTVIGSGTTPIEEDFGGGWWEVGVGANINLSKATYIYADIEKTFGGEVDTNWQWNLGVRYSF